jgi:hypothetical protein
LEGESLNLENVQNIVGEVSAFFDLKWEFMFQDRNVGPEIFLELLEANKGCFTTFVMSIDSIEPVCTVEEKLSVPNAEQFITEVCMDNAVRGCGGHIALVLECFANFAIKHFAFRG